MDAHIDLISQGKNKDNHQRYKKMVSNLTSKIKAYNKRTTAINAELNKLLKDCKQVKVEEPMVNVEHHIKSLNDEIKSFQDVIDTNLSKIVELEFAISNWEILEVALHRFANLKPFEKERIKMGYLS